MGPQSTTQIVIAKMASRKELEMRLTDAQKEIKVGNRYKFNGHAWVVTELVLYLEPQTMGMQANVALEGWSTGHKTLRTAAWLRAALEVGEVELLPEHATMKG